MKNIPLTPERMKAILEYYNKCGSKRETCKAMNTSSISINRILMEERGERHYDPIKLQCTPEEKKRLEAQLYKNSRCMRSKWNQSDKYAEIVKVFQETKCRGDTAKITGVSGHMVDMALIDAGICTELHISKDREALIKSYLDEGLSVCKITQLVKGSYPVIRKVANKYGIVVK